MTQPTVSSPQTSPLRLWPGVLLAVILFIVRFGLPVINSDWSMPAMMGSLGLAAAILLWWLLFSKAPVLDRLLAPVLIAVCALAARLFVHESVATAGYGQLYWVYALPLLGLALVAWAALFGSRTPAQRRVAMAIAFLLSAGSLAAIRLDGTDGAFAAEMSPRWSQTAEDRLVASGDAAVSVTGAPPIDTGGGWSAFRGPARDGRISNLRINTDWEASPPKELWRRAIGPGWGSFAVRGDLLYTQEQRGEDEVVAAYRVGNGEPVWKHRDPVRFWEAIAGAGPRSTPTVAGNKVYSLGATGILNALDADDGRLLWSRDTVEDTGAVIPDWGISGSPLVFGDANTVYLAASGALAAYDAETGAVRWKNPPTDKESYSSPHLFRSGDTNQVLLLNSDGTKAVDPDDGSLLWSHKWPGGPIVQPAFTDDGDILINSTSQNGLRRLAVSGGPGNWSVEEKWTSIRLKPYFNDFVVHKGFAYGFDGRILAAMDLADGKRAWKGGRYGNGQLVLLADQDLLLVLTEDGDLALVSATPDGFTELSTAPAIDGKTWNHPVVVGRVLLVRNGVEMAAFQLPEPAT